MASLASAIPGYEKRPRWLEMPRHRHDHGYLSLVLSGGYEETGDRGRFRLEPDDILVHGAFDTHLNRFAGREAEILNLSAVAIMTGKPPEAWLRTRSNGFKN